jgi:dolichyl-diphosphooligosaccharide--protein glycosyltransferase
MKFTGQNSKKLFLAIIIILLVGISIRYGSIDLTGVSLEEKDYYKDAGGQNYMYDMDSYYNYRLSRNLLENGHIYESIKYNQAWDTLSYYPPGVPFDYPPLISYISVLFYHIINFFHSIELISVCYWIPMFIGPLAGIILLLFVYRIRSDSQGIWGGMAGGLLLVTSPFYFMRTVPGFFDTDMFIILFSLLTSWLLWESLKSSKTSQQILLIIMASISILLFSLAWTGWQLFYFIILITGVIFFINGRRNGYFTINIKNNGIKRALAKNKFDFRIIYLIIGFLVLSMILIITLNHPNNLFKIINGPLTALKLGSTQIWGSWPDVYNSITELQSPSILDIIIGIGPFLLILGFIGSLITIRNLFNKSPYYDLKSLDNGVGWDYGIHKPNDAHTLPLASMQFLNILILIWVLTAIITLNKGIRFELLLIGPLSILAGLLYSSWPEYLDRLVSKSKFKSKSEKKYLNKTGFKMVLLNIVFLVLIISPSLIIVESSSHTLIPRANDDFWDSALWIKDNTSQDTVIIADWIHGHFFAAIGQRPVNFDGRLAYIETIPDRSETYKNSGMDTRIPNVYRHYWQNKALVTSNHSLSQGILRMISSSGDQAYLTLESYNHNQSLSVKILEDILGLNKKEALNVLIEKYGVDNFTAFKIISFTHPSKINHYIMTTSDDYITKGYWNLYYGSWDFDNENSNVYPYSYGQILENKNGLIKTDDNTIINIKTRNATWNGENPGSLIVINDDSVSTTVIDEDSDFNIYLLLNKYQTVVLNKKYEKSVFVDLVLKNNGSGYYELAYNKGSLYLWKEKL